MSHLLLTLGHNSSAILVDDGKILIGYENERLTKVKSDSSFPVAAILEIKKYYNLYNVTDIYISHWFTNLAIPLEEQGKWYQHDTIKQLFPNANIHTLHRDFTHHDAHKSSLDCFTNGIVPTKSHTFIVDGFGSYGETISVYNGNDLIHRSYGFSSSLGLYYQYATSYLDMRENQDEYKLLGYEAKIGETPHMEQINKLATERAMRFIEKILASTIESKFDPLISLSALTAIKKEFRDEFDYVLDQLSVHEDMQKKIVLSYYVQSVVEITLGRLMIHFNVVDLRLAGGVFMNVKLNNELAHQVMGITTIMPLCGDQGAAIGLYHHHHELEWPKHLFWGKRPRIISPDKKDWAACNVVDALARNKIVNLVQGSMEFGARALGHTSTLALPTMANVKYINHLNGRSSIMPMAPMLSRHAANTFFEDEDDIWESLYYMICARDCRDGVDPMNYGVTHIVPGTLLRTCRPQIIRNDPFLEEVLEAHGVLINTSFNEHGRPILFDQGDIDRCHAYQKERDHDDRVITVVLGECQ